MAPLRMMASLRPGTGPELADMRIRVTATPDGHNKAHLRAPTAGPSRRWCAWRQGEETLLSRIAPIRDR